MLKTWIELNEAALTRNIRTFRRLIGKKVKLWSVVKSNAYGHGLLDFSRLAARRGVDGFCVDSVIEGEKIRAAGIKQPILVLGRTFSDLFRKAAKKGIVVTIGSMDALNDWLKSSHRPDIHLKIDTGMHRQGFYPAELPGALYRIKKAGLASRVLGLYTHFASAKDVTYPAYTGKQFAAFEKAVTLAKSAGFDGLMCHAAATAGTILDKRYHLDAVRVGIGLFGLYPSKEIEMQHPEIKLTPVLSWKTVVSEIKPIKRGEFIGYDLTERVTRDTRYAVLPIGYWHGYSWRLGSTGEVIIRGKRARVLGRVSMDVLTVDIGKLRARVGDEALLIGKGVTAEELARKTGTSHYEIITRLNPLIKKIVV